MKRSKLKEIIREEIAQVLKEKHLLSTPLPKDKLVAGTADQEIYIKNDELASKAEDILNKLRFRFDYTFSSQQGGVDILKFKKENDFKNAVAILRKKLGAQVLTQESVIFEDMKLDVDNFTATLKSDNKTLWIVPKSGKRVDEKDILKKLKPFGIKKVDYAEMDSFKVIFKSPVNFWEIRYAIWGK